MAEITRRRSGELLRGVFEILKDHPEGLSVKQVLARMEKTVPPTPFEASDYPNRPGIRRYEKIIRFTTINAVKAGWLVKSRGHWTLTDEGRREFERLKDPEEFLLEAIRLYKQWKAQQPEEPEEDEEEEKEVITEYEEAEEIAWSKVHDHLSTMNPYDFQRLVSGLLSGMGYYVAWTAPVGPDGGVDIVAHTDPLGFVGPRIKVQVKRRQQSIPVAEVRAFMATLGDGDTGLFVSTGGFTSESEREVRGQEKRRVMLVDLQRLFELWVQHYDKIPEQDRRLLPLRPVYYLAPQD